MDYVDPYDIACADCGRSLDGAENLTITVVDIGGHPLPICLECKILRRKPAFN